MPAVVSWSSIELLHNVVRTFRQLEQVTGEPPPVVTCRSKIKLHGTNCAVQIGEALVCQGRTTLLEPGADHKGFATWVHAHAAWFRAIRPDTVVFGEWCGPGIEKGMAISKAPTKVFAVFAAQLGRGEDARVVVEPGELAALLPADGAPDALHVLPWEDDRFTVDFGDRDSLERTATSLNDRIAAVEAGDPWVLRTFGVSGLGEGLVFYPVAADRPVPSDPESFAHWMFKAKGEKHRTTGSSVAVRVEPSSVASIDAFVTLMVTEARLEQGLSACGGARDPRKTGEFLAWIAADVKKESVAEREVAGLDWPMVERAVVARARAWYRGAP
jgi:hypothetical protein